MASDIGLATLLDLNGSIIAQEHGCRVKIEAWEARKSDEMPHGIRYCLTLHDRHGTRILGYDNAHALKPSKMVLPEGASRSTTGTGMPGTRALPTNLKAPTNCLPTSSRKSTLS